MTNPGPTRLCPQVRIFRACAPLALLALTLGCSLLPASAPEIEYRGTIARSCGPTDAAGYELILSPVSGEHAGEVVFVVWDLPIRPGRTIRLSNSARGAQASLVTAPQVWVVGISGSIRFAELAEGDGAAGSWSVTFDDGTSLRGAFSAQWLDQGPVFCG